MSSSSNPRRAPRQSLQSSPAPPPPAPPPQQVAPQHFYPHYPMPQYPMNPPPPQQYQQYHLPPNDPQMIPHSQPPPPQMMQSPPQPPPQAPQIQSSPSKKRKQPGGGPMDSPLGGSLGPSIADLSSLSSSAMGPGIGDPGGSGLKDEDAMETPMLPMPKKSRTNTPWSPAEEHLLRQRREAGQTWGEIAKDFPQRTEGSVKKHWYKDMHYAEFAEDESQMLLNAIKEYDANKWKVIGQKVGKPAKACEQYAKDHFQGKI